MDATNPDPTTVLEMVNEAQRELIRLKGENKELLKVSRQIIIEIDAVLVNPEIEDKKLRQSIGEIVKRYYK